MTSSENGMKFLATKLQDIFTASHTVHVATIYSSTCRRACSSRVCLDTDRAQTVSQRVLSSCIWTLTQEESSRLPSISSLAERFRAWTLLVLFPSSFWKT